MVAETELTHFTEEWHSEPYPAIDTSRPELNAFGKTIVITGGATTIGKATAIAFAKAGASAIAILGRRLEKLEEAAKDIVAHADNPDMKIWVEPVDVTQKEALYIVAQNILRLSDGEKVHVLVHSAAISPDADPVLATTSQEVLRGFDSILVGTLLTIQAFEPVFASNASVFNISSALAHIEPSGTAWAYSALKAASTKLFDYLQDEKPEWQVFNIQTGIIKSELNERFGVVSDDVPELPGQFILWLASAEASFLKGKFVYCNWDVEELVARADEIKDSLLLRVVLNSKSAQTSQY